MTREAKQRLHALNELPPIIVMGNPAWRPSLVGLVATSLTETYSCPAFIWGRDGQGIIKGSCRSGNGLSILELMEAASHTFITYGGHHASGGFSVANDHIHGLQGALIEAYERIARERSHTTTEMYLDAELSLEEVDDALMGVLASLAPFGVGNPKPIFRFPNIVPSRIVSFGKADNHTKLFFDTRGIAREAIAFFKRPDEFSVIPRVGKQLSLIAHLERSHFMGDIGTRLRIVDIV
jgi:single-stranded-DNA-specific exonuclease